MKTFEDLDVWKKARQVRVYIYHISKKFPPEEKYGVTGQIKRAARSVTNNIAEGYGRYHYQENIQFCRISRGSLNETLDHVIIAVDENMIDGQDLVEFRILYTDCLRLLNGYIAYLQKSKLGT